MRKQIIHYSISFKSYQTIFIQKIVFFYCVASLLSHIINTAKTSVQHDFWWKVKNHVISSFMLYGGFVYIIPLRERLLR